MEFNSLSPEETAANQALPQQQGDTSLFDDPSNYESEKRSAENSAKFNPPSDETLFADPSEHVSARRLDRHQVGTQKPIITPTPGPMPNVPTPDAEANDFDTGKVQGLDNFRARADISLSNTLDAKRKKMQEYFPGSNLMQQWEVTDPTHPEKKEPVLYFTMKQGEPPVRFSQTTIQAVKNWGQTVAGELKEFGTRFGTSLLTEEPDPEWYKERDIASKRIETGYQNVMNNIFADNAGEMPAALGAILGGTATQEAHWFWRILGTTAGATAGEGLGIASEAMRQYTVQDPTGMMTKAGENAAFGAFGGEILGKIFRVVGGHGIYTLDAAGKQLLDTAKELNLPMPNPAQVLAGRPGLMHLYKQLKSMNPLIEHETNAQEQAAFAKLREMSPIQYDKFGHPIADTSAYTNIRPQLKGAWDDYIDTLDQRYPKPNLNVSSTNPPLPGEQRLPLSSMEVAGQNLDAGLEIYKNQSQQDVQALYENASRGTPPRFDLTRPLAEIDNVRIGNTTPGLPTQVPGMPGLMQNTTRRTNAPISPELNRIFTEIEYTDPAQMTVDAVNKFREQLYNYAANRNALGRIQGGTTTAEDAYAATDVRNALSNMLDTPVNLPPEQMRVWRQASFAARERFNNLDTAKVIQVAKSGEGDLASTLEGFAKSLVASGPVTTGSSQLSNLRMLQKILPRDQFMALPQAVEDAVRQGSPAQIWSWAEKLDSMPAERKILFGTNYWNAEIMPFAKSMHDLTKTNIPAIIDNDTNAWQIANKFTNGGSAGIDKTFEIVGGRDTPAGRSIRAGVIDQIINTASEIHYGSTVINGNALYNAINNADNKNLLKFLSSDDVYNLKGVAYYLRGIQKGTEGSMGDSLQAATEFAKVRHLEVEAVYSLMKANVLSHVMTSSAGRWVFYGGTGAFKIPGSHEIAINLPKISAALAEMSRDRDEEARSDSTFMGRATKQFNKLFGGFR